MTVRYFGQYNDRVTVKIAGQLLTGWTQMQLTRNMGELAGSFSLAFYDRHRSHWAMGPEDPDHPIAQALVSGHPADIMIDDELVLRGWIDDLSLAWSADDMTAEIQGRDVTGDLVDCAAAPYGPTEYRNVTLLDLAQAICAPFKITARAECDVGAPFEKFSLDVAETAFAALEKAARQRSCLLMSDGIGGLVITRAGKNRAPAPLRSGEIVQDFSIKYSLRQRFSDYFIKGQSANGGGARGPMVRTASALRTDVPPPSAAQRSAAPTPSPTRGRRGNGASGVIMTGHAHDADVTRWRPTVKMVKTQSGSGVSSGQEQAEFHARVAVGKSLEITHKVLDWRAGDDNRLWRPNEMTPVVNKYAYLEGQALISGVTYSLDDNGATTELRLCGQTAFERINEPPRRGRRHRGEGRRGPMVTTATPLQTQVQR